MSSIKLDRAYCVQTDSVLTIYEVRDLHFDENEDFNAKGSQYLCPDADCEAILVGVNHAKAEFKNAPHFRLKKDQVHSDICDLRDESANEKKDDSTDVRTERPHKISDHPEVLLLERQPVPSGTGKAKKKRESSKLGDRDNPTSVSSEDKRAPHETSCLEHIVQTWVSNSPEDLQNSLLTIGEKTKYYRNALKYINYFTDERGLIYWGNVDSIKKYGEDYCVKFKERPFYEKKKRQLTIYIPESLINRYRKRKLFRHYVDSLIDQKIQQIECYFVGAYPELKSTKVVTPTGNFTPLEVHIENLDHLVLRFDEDGQDI